MDLVYSCRPFENEELRYSIRSAVKHLDYGSIWLVGSKPDWYKGNFLSVDNIGNKYRNISNCLRHAVESDKISNDFIFMNDDFYVMKNIRTIPVVHGGLLSKRVAEYQELSTRSTYTTEMSKTLRYLIKSGYSDPLDYDIHVPMNMNKEMLDKALKSKCQPRSVYGNIANVGGEQIKDVKVYRFGPLTSRSFDYKNNDFSMISSQDDSFEMLREELLDKVFINKSEHEKY
jgi:hypothetical protein